MINAPPPHLRPCDGFWGGTTLIQEDPKQSHAQHTAIYVPMLQGAVEDNKAHPWGLYHNMYPMIAGMDARGPEKTIKNRMQGLLRVEPRRRVQGHHIYGGMMHLHYGHFLTNTLPRLWLCARQKRKANEKILFHSNCGPQAWFKRAFIREVFAALGLKQEDLAIYYQPVFLDRLTIPHTSLVEQFSVHAVYGELTEEIGRKVLGLQPIHRNPRPVYLSKTALSSGVGHLSNEVIIERALEAAGYDIVHPELLTFAEQVRLFCERERIVAYSGSALHTSVFARKSTEITVLCGHSRPNSNFSLLDQVSGHRPRYVYSPGSAARKGNDGKFGTHIEIAEPELVARDLLAMGGGEIADLG